MSSKYKLSNLQKPRGFIFTTTNNDELMIEVQTDNLWKITSYEVAGPLLRARKSASKQQSKRLF